MRKNNNGNVFLNVLPATVGVYGGNSGAALTVGLFGQTK
jgi:hypothetical protein